MCKKLFLLFSFVVVLSLASITYGDYVISDFNNPDDPNDGWALVDPNNPNIIVTNVDIGDGNSLQITDTTGGGAEQAITYSLVAHVNDVNEFRKHTKVSLDLTRLASEWGGPWGGWNEVHTAFTGYSEFHLIIEAGRDINDANGPYWEKGWNLLSQRANWGSWNGDYPINFTYDYSTILKEIDFNNLGYLGFTLQTNWGGYTPGGVCYLDNVQLVSEGMAYEPNPANHAVDVQEDSELSWTQGAYADKHDVYFGTSFDDVNDANRASHPGLLCYSEDQEPNYYDPGTLELYTTYYWRIDEVNGPNICKGEVWDFMAAYPGMGVVIGDWENGMNGWKAAWQGDTTFSYSTKGGTVTLGDYSLGVQTVKLADEDPGYWIIKRDGVLDLTDMRLDLDIALIASEWSGEEVIVGPLVVQSDLSHTWSQYIPTAIDRNTGESVPSIFMLWTSTRGNAYRTYTFDFSDYSDWADANEMTILLALQNPGQGLGTFYLDNARLLDVHLASNPRPGHCATGVDTGVDKMLTLSWTAGKDATTHDVYFGTDETAVTDATTSTPDIYKGNQLVGDVDYGPVGPLGQEETYYWRIDELGAPGGPYTGVIWRFTTANYIVVDDFESYPDTSPPVELRAVWAKLGDAVVFLETDIVHGGTQSMEFHYKKWYANGYAEVCRTVSDPNWKSGGVEALDLWFYGKADNNDVEQMYVKLEDASISATVPYDGDMNDLKIEQWQVWRIDLDDFSGVTLSQVEKITIGFSYSVDMDAVDSFVYFDDIRLYPSRCVPEYAPADFTGDCVIDLEDLDIMTGDWLESEYDVPAEPNSDANLVAHYEFEENLLDSFGGHHGDPCGNAATVYDAVRDSNVLSLDGDDDYVVITGSNTPGGPFDINDVITVACWIKVTEFDKDWQAIVTKGDDSWRMARASTGTGEGVEFACTGLSPYQWVSGDIRVDDDQWHHVAGVYDGSKLCIYVDGILDFFEYTSGSINSSSHNVLIGENEQETGREWNGLIDELRIYNRALSHGEIVSLAGESSVLQPLPRPEIDLHKDGKVNLKDYAVLANSWLETILWP